MSMFDESGGDNTSRANEVMNLLKIIGDSDGELNDWEYGFVSDMRARVNQYHERTLVSPKQLFRLREIKDKTL